MINRRESHKGAFPPVLLLGRVTNIYKALNSDVYGQDECKKQILSGMYRLTTGATNKPVVLTVNLNNILLEASSVDCKDTPKSTAHSARF